MTIVKTVKEQSIKLRKARDPLALVLSSVLNQAQSTAKIRAFATHVENEVSDEDMVLAIRKTIKQCDDMIKLAPEDSIQYQQSVLERELLESLLPEETSLEDIKEAIVMLMADEDDFSMKHMGKVMKHLSVKFGTSLNKAQASSEVKRYLEAMAAPD